MKLTFIIVKNIIMNLGANEYEQYWLKRKEINKLYKNKRKNLEKEYENKRKNLEKEYEKAIAELDDKFGNSISIWVQQKKKLIEHLEQKEKEKRKELEGKQKELEGKQKELEGKQKELEGKKNELDEVISLKQIIGEENIKTNEPIKMDLENKEESENEAKEETSEEKNEEERDADVSKSSCSDETNVDNLNKKRKV